MKTIKQKQQIEKSKKEVKITKFLKSCPNGGICINPLCMFGCVDN